MWNAPILFPYHDTLAFSENLFGVAFFVAPVYWISGNPLLTYNTAFLASFVMAGAGMYLLARDLTGSRPAAAVGATFYAFCPFRMAQIAHVQMVATGWIPIALWALHRYFATRARAWLFVVAAAWVVQTLSNSYIGYFLLVPGVAVIADGLSRGPNRRRALVDLLAAGALIAATLTPVAAAYYRVRSSYHQVRPTAEIAAFGADVRSYAVGKTNIGVWRHLPTAVPSDPEKELFPGVVAVALAAIAVWRRDRAALLYGGAALAGFAFSLGPQVRVWGHVITGHGPYAWLLPILPGMDGMRVPARFAIVVFVGLSVMAACGARALFERVPASARPAALVIGLMAIVCEGWAVPLPTEPFPPRARPEDRAVALWLRDRPPGAVLHLPLTSVPAVELQYQYATLWHGHPIVNGYSGYSAPLQDFLRDSSSPLFDFSHFAATIAMLRAIGVRYVVVHAGDYGPATRDRAELAPTIEALRSSTQTDGEMRFMQTTAFELAPARMALVFRSTSRVDPREFTVSASEAPDRVRALLDGDPDSRWMAGLSGQDGSSWIAARFAVPVDVSRVELQFAERSLADYPRALRIDVTDPTGASRTLYDASPYPELASAILRDPRYPALEIDLSPNQTATLTIRQTAPTRRAWSIHELRLWRR